MNGRPGEDDDPFPVRRTTVQGTRSQAPARASGYRPQPQYRPRRRPSARVRRRRTLVGLVGAFVLVWAGVGGVRALTHDDPPATRAAAGIPTLATPSASAAPSVTDTPREPAATPSPSPSGSTGDPSAAAPDDADARAGVLERRVPQRGTGKLTTVPGDSPAPHKGRVKRVRIRVEGGLPLDGARFAEFAMATLNDSRSWSHDGYAFARTDSADADVTLVLASPTLSRSMCRPLETMGTLSCHSGANTVLTWYRWVLAIPDYNGDLEGYRHYVVNHEVGHALGHGHEYCGGKGRRAPLMMQQTKGLKGCRPNPWPYP